MHYFKGGILYEKRILTVVLSMVLLGAVGTMTVLAVERKAQKNTCTTYMDVNGDGICDNQENKVGFVDENDDGICDKQEKNNGFIDENGNCVCDNRSRSGHGCKAKCMK